VPLTPNERGGRENAERERPCELRHAARVRELGATYASDRQRARRSAPGDEPVHRRKARRNALSSE
jgi:hypothetical protein